MKITRHYNEQELKSLIAKAVEVKTGSVVKIENVEFTVKKECDGYDRPVGVFSDGYDRPVGVFSVTCNVVIDGE